MSLPPQLCQSKLFSVCLLHVRMCWYVLPRDAVDNTVCSKLLEAVQSSLQTEGIMELHDNDDEKAVTKKV